jgi:hypothetical protein
MTDRAWYNDAPKCVGLGGWLFGHRFTARESTRSRTTPISHSGLFTEIHGFQQDELDTTYHGDVCTRCGLVVNVPRSAAAPRPDGEDA